MSVFYGRNLNPKTLRSGHGNPNFTCVKAESFSSKNIQIQFASGLNSIGIEIKGSPFLVLSFLGAAWRVI
jgi:hypothetical protein